MWILGEGKMGERAPSSAPLLFSLGNGNLEPREWGTKDKSE
jgi:hypothetical protein